MRRRASLLVVAAALVIAAGAAASPRAARLRLDGRVSPELRAWADEASANVPLPSVQVTVRYGSPMAAGNTIFLPFGWGPHTVHGLFLHELGHVYDAYEMTPTRRERFLHVARVPCRWTAAHCRTARWVSGPGVYVDVGPQEMFAEMYAACALGLTERGYQVAGFNTYGWVPPDGTDGALCDVIRGG